MPKTGNCISHCWECKPKIKIFTRQSKPLVGQWDTRCVQWSSFQTKKNDASTAAGLLPLPPPPHTHTRLQHFEGYHRVKYLRRDDQVRVRKSNSYNSYETLNTLCVDESIASRRVPYGLLRGGKRGFYLSGWMQPFVDLFGTVYCHWIFFSRLEANKRYYKLGMVTFRHKIIFLTIR